MIERIAMTAEKAKPLKIGRLQNNCIGYNKEGKKDVKMKVYP